MSTGYISQLPPKEGWMYHNHGINGAQVPALIQLVQSNTITVKPSAVIVMVGGNDVSNSIPFTKYTLVEFGRLGRPRTNAERFAEEMEELFNAIELKWGKIPFGVFNLKPASEDIIGSLNKICVGFLTATSLQNVVRMFTNATYIDMSQTTSTS